MSRSWLRRLFGLDSQQQTLARKGRWLRPQVEVLEGRLAPAVQLLYGGPGSILHLTEAVSGATPTVTIAEPAPNLLTLDLGTGHRFDPSSTGMATGLTYYSGTPAASQSATIYLGAANNVSTLQAALVGDALVLGPIIDAVGGLGNVAASAGVIRVTGLNTSHASVGNGNVDLKAAGDLTMAANAVLFAGAGTVMLAADVNADGTGDDGVGALTVQAGAVVTSNNPTSSAVTLRGAAVHLDASASPAVVGAGHGPATPFVTNPLSGPYGLAFDARGNLYVANYFGNTVSEVAAGSSTATPFVTSGLNQPAALAFDASGNLYVANSNNGTVSEVAAGSGTAAPFVTSGLNVPFALAFDASGNLYVTNFGNDTVSEIPLVPLPGGVVIRSSLPGRPMLLGDTSHPVDGINLSRAELALVHTTGPLTFDAGGGGALELNDQSDPAAAAFTVTAATVAWRGPTFTYAGVSAVTIKGGSGGNTFAVLGTSATAAVTVVGGGSGDTLAGSDAGNLFALAGGNAGTLSGSAYGGSVTFAGVGNLRAGAGGDTFQFADGAALTGTIVGGGSATLDYSAYTTSVVVDFQTGFATGVGGTLTGIASVLGGSGTPAGAGAYNLLIGSGGDYLQGGAGRRNLLVAGGSASTLVGGDGEDLLIAGFTAYDAEAGLTSWLQIAAYWAGTDDYATRASNLSSGTAVPLLDATVVTGDGGGNVLGGNGALALIFSDGQDTIGGFDPNSQVVAVAP